MVGVPCHLILSIKNGEDGGGEVGLGAGSVCEGFLLKDQNLLSMTSYLQRIP